MQIVQGGIHFVQFCDGWLVLSSPVRHPKVSPTTFFPEACRPPTIMQVPFAHPPVSPELSKMLGKGPSLSHLPLSE